MYFDFMELEFYSVCYFYISISIGFIKFVQYHSICVCVIRSCLCGNEKCRD